MSIASPPTRSARPRWLRSRRLRGRTLAAIGVIVLGGALLVVVAESLGSGAGPQAGSDNGSATSSATVTRRSLSAQVQVSATLGFAGSSSIVVPAGTAPAEVLQARQAVASARAALQPAQATLAADRQALAQAQAKLAADRQKLASDCAGDNAAGSGSNDDGSDDDGSGSVSSPCATTAQAVESDEEAVATAQAKLTTDIGAVAGAETALASAEESLSAAEVSAAVYGLSSTYTMLPAVGQVIRRGQALYRISGQPVVLLYGAVTPWRAFRPGMSPGRDVAVLNANLRALGYGGGLTGDRFGADTAAAIKAFQAAHGLSPTGQLMLGSVVFKPRPVRVTSVTPTVGAAVEAGVVLGVSSTARQVTIELDAAQQSEVEVGDRVTITLPDNRTTPGVVSSVGSVATTPSSDDPESSNTPTVEVHVTPTDPAATGRLDQASVSVSIITATVENALVVPVTALLALAGGGYAVEEIGSGGVRRLVPVELGLFDDSEGLVQVTGTGLHAGQRIVVPAS